MGLLDTLFNWVLTREQRERHSRAVWEKSVCRSSFPEVPATPYNTPTTPRSEAMTPSLSSSSTSSTSSAVSSGICSPVRSRPSTSYSTSPRPEYRRHTSITRSPISYDALIDTKSPTPAPPTKPTATAAPPLLYPLPPLGPMEGIGKYRRSIHVTEQFIDSLRRDNIAALQPLPSSTSSSPTNPAPYLTEDEPRQGRRLWRDCPGNRTTTTPPRAYSTSPTILPAEESPRRQRSLPPRWKAAAEIEVEEVVEPVRKGGRGVQSKRRVQGGRGKQQRVGGGKRQPAGPYPLPKAPRITGLGLKRVAPGRNMSASMETLLSGEE
ncbi:unnamed protein product [Tuber melanosporum]|uniref:(Perigord truffle) hypothetical protein n=1 Tax=Tuber melanosporum (strain Mel28) TaxID=656061 RepID=D5GAR0_TUBMM|nr:uncharacterized protein GSTUM_00003747001 [Tuber melanosporum]CAZ81603.1 unnamed protein product [Tuber melanosporum]